MEIMQQVWVDTASYTETLSPKEFVLTGARLNNE